MPFRFTVFQRILEPLDRRFLSRIAEKHDANRGVSVRDGWTFQRHLKAMLFAQFAGLGSLRELVEGLSARPEGLYHLDLKVPARSTLSDASASRPATAFQAVAEQLLAGLRGATRREAQEVIRLLDGSPIPLRDERFSWAKADSRCRGLKLHLLYDPRAEHPVHFGVEAPNVPELAIARELPLEGGATYVFDKGYTDYRWWRDIDQKGAFFVTRLKKNVHRRHERPNAVAGEGIISDCRLRIGHHRPRGGAPVNPLFETDLREIVVSREGKTPLHLITNDHTRSATEIAELYRERWKIELFFKWIKQNLRIKRFLGRSENAVRIQVYVALIAFCLLHIFRKTYAASHLAGPKSLLARLKTALLSPFDLTGQSKPPPRPPAFLKPASQLALPLQSRHTQNPGQ